MSEPLLPREVRRRLAIIQHAEEVTGNVAMTCRYYGISRTGAVGGRHEVGVGLDHFGDALRLFALPARAGEQKRATAISSGAAARVGEVIGVGIDELDRVVTPGSDLRERQNQRLCARVRVGCLDGGVGRGVNPRGVVDDVLCALVVRILLVDEVRVLDAVAVDIGKP
jgi:hypothetical protein